MPIIRESCSRSLASPTRFGVSAVIATRKSALVMKKALRPVIEQMEQRQLLSAALSVSSGLMVFNAVNGTTSVSETLTLTDTGDASLTLGSSAFALANDPSSG